MKIHTGPYPGMAYAKFSPGNWRFSDSMECEPDHPKPTGPSYRTRADLLNDMESYANIYGFDKKSRST